LIKVKACGICGSDVKGMNGSTGRRQPPIIMGHEASGVVIETGSGVTEWEKDDKVTFDSTIYCGQCDFCLKGRFNLCNNRRVLGVSCDEYRQHGAFAEYIAIPQHILYKLPDAITFEQASMVETLSIAFHAVKRTPLSPNDTVVVMGVGMIGLLLVQSLKLSGCQVIAVDIDQSKLDLAKSLGIKYTLNANEVDVQQEILAITKNQGADAAFEAIGISSTIAMAINSVRKGGSLTLIGNISPKVELLLQSVVTRELTLYGSCASCGEYPDCLNKIADGSINVDVLISKIAPLSEGNEWFERLYNKEQGLMKVILTP
jgi:L-iditol 2-dehydrogenase